MTNSELFKKAHKLTKKTIKAGDSYQVTFGVCLRIIKAQHNKPTLKQRLKMVRKAYKLAKSMKNDTIHGTWSTQPVYALFKQAYQVEYKDCTEYCPRLGFRY